jgi:RNA polymerase sigma factor (TIGR02999 family)
MGPTPDKAGEITELLHQWKAGDSNAESHLFEIVMPSLRGVAGYLMRGERKDHSLQATELISEAYLRLLAARDQDWQSRKHFFAVAARIMRRYLIDHARRPRAAKEPLDSERHHPLVDSPVEAIVLGELLDELARVHPDWCTAVEMKHFLGFTDIEAAGEMGIPLRTLQRMWLDARKWLYERLSDRDEKNLRR